MAAINNPSGLSQSSLKNLPPEIIQKILEVLDNTALLNTRTVCKGLNCNANELIRQQWNETKKLPPNNVIPLQEMMASLETKDPNADPLMLFGRLAKLFSDTYGIHIHQPTVPCSATEIANLQTIAKQIEDQSLITLWDQIRLQLNLPVPLQTADAIRAWMNDPANAGQLNSIITLRVVMGNLKTIPSEIRLLTQLRHLNLAGNQITEIPDAIRALTQLRHLELTRNLIREIPDAICALTQLQQLYLANNQITAIPDAISDLTQLPHLNLNSNLITVIPGAIRALTKLTHLSLAGNKITEIPNTISALTQLLALNLSGNQITVIPNAISALTQLQELYLTGNQITVIPNAIRDIFRARPSWSVWPKAVPECICKTAF